MKLVATLTVPDAERIPWETVVIGAGPAGAFLSLLLARKGVRVLLIEKKEFPREKVCGGCLGPRAVDLLKVAGLHSRLNETPSSTTNRLCLHTARRTAEIALPPGLAMQRSRLDAMLVEAATAGGAAFLPRTNARLRSVASGLRQIECRQDGGMPFSLRAKVVIASDGLMNSSLPDEANLQSRIAPAGRLGMGAVIDQPDDVSDRLGIHAGVIHMSVSGDGYVGLTRPEPHKVIVAAATDAAFLNRKREPAQAVAAVLAAAGQQNWAEMAAGRWRTATWQGTPPLTRRLDQPAAERLFVVGDAAGYIEPFTGEGITWALTAAEALAPLVVAARTRWDPRLQRAWLAYCRDVVARRQRLCRGFAWFLRSPRLVNAAMRVLSVAPGCSAPLVRYWNRSIHLGGNRSL